MLKRYWFIGLAIFTISAQSFALETDNYIAWNVDLEDSTPAVNRYLAEQIQIAIDEANNKRLLPNCEKMTELVGKRFRTSPPMKHPMEDWLRENLDEKHVYPHNAWYAGMSIYRNPSRFYLRNMMIAPNVRIGEVYLGTDKLSHFASTGRRYFEHYMKRVNNGWEDIEAQKSAIRFGLWNEMTILGFWPGGVFSYGDMEANYQGFTFYKKMCMDEKDTFLEQDESGFWSLVKKPNILDYVSPYWDETFNLSVRDRWNWAKTSRIIKEDYCPMMTSPKVMSRMDKYKHSTHTSFSLEYIKELQEFGYKHAPIPEDFQSITKLCEEVDHESESAPQ